MQAAASRIKLGLRSWSQHLVLLESRSYVDKYLNSQPYYPISH